MRPRLLLLDEPTEGIQPSIIKDIGRAIAYLRNLGQMAIVLVEQYFDFASELGDHFAVMDAARSSIPAAATTMDEAALKRAHGDLTPACGLLRRRANVRAAVGRSSATIFAANRARRPDRARGRSRRRASTRRARVHEDGSLRVRFPGTPARRAARR